MDMASMYKIQSPRKSNPLFEVMGVFEVGVIVHTFVELGSETRSERVSTSSYATQPH